MEQNSKHTQGKLNVAMGSLQIWANNTDTICYLTDTLPEYKANAARIVECWNEWDNIQDALECTQNALNDEREKRDTLEAQLETGANQYAKAIAENGELKESISILQKSNDLVKQELDRERELNSELAKNLNWAYERLNIETKKEFIKTRFNLSTHEGKADWESYLNGMCEIEKSLRKATQQK